MLRGLGRSRQVMIRVGYWVVLAVSTSPDQLSAQDSESILSARTIASACVEAGEIDPATEGILAGILESGTSPLGGAEVVVVSKADADGVVAQRSTRTTDDGLFVLCGVPEGPVSVMVLDERTSVPPRDVEVSRGAVHRVDFVLESPSETGPAGLYGYVRDGASRQPIVAAEVAVAGRVVTTNAAGFFALEDLDPGVTSVAVTHLGHGGREVEVELLPGRSSRIDVEMVVDAIELEPIEVTVGMGLRARQMLDFERRRELASGIHYDFEGLQKRAPYRVSDLIRDLGVRTHQDGPFGNLEVELRGRSCLPAVWVDGRLAVFDGQVWMRDLGLTDLEAVELYKKGSVPPEFYSPPRSGDCVVLVVWTR